MICGNCKMTDSTLVHVKACYANAPTVAPPRDPAPQTANVIDNVPAGRYAVNNQEGILRFYKVDKPDDGRWKGYTFVSVLASDEKIPLRNRASRDAVLRAIVDVGPREASLRFGREIGACGICGRTLTDAESRANGIGPICAGKAGW